MVSPSIRPLKNETSTFTGLDMSDVDFPISLITVFTMPNDDEINYNNGANYSITQLFSKS